ncbi:MAG: hypothetical protein H6510_10875 [Acidobacteria bacterium]|nr:hypothetical protein [Acidobacteriota bacterium]MCB9398313.1 hypothetical protein [Acidobacteriota bacterium]
MLRTLILMALCGSLVFAGETKKNVPFKLDQWVELKSTDGPVTLHRIRIVEQSGGLTKSKLMRPGNAEHLQTIQIQIEYSNSASRDWDAHLDIAWVDADGVVIDGYNDKENLDSEESYEKVTVTLSTLKYGLKRAKTLKVKISYEPD